MFFNAVFACRKIIENKWIFPSVFLCIFAIEKQIRIKNKNRQIIMKKFILPLMAAVLMGVTFTSCEKEYLIQSTNTEVGTVTISNSDWSVFPGNMYESQYLEAEVSWDAITPDVLDYGNVNVYVYAGNKQFSLPYVCPITYTLSDGTQIVVAENVKFYLKPGKIYIVMQDLDGELPEGYIEDMTFRMVVTYPVNYVMDAKK